MCVCVCLLHFYDTCLSVCLSVYLPLLSFMVVVDGGREKKGRGGEGRQMG